MNLDAIRHPVKTFRAGQTRKGNNLALAQQRAKDSESAARKKVYQGKWDNLLDKLSQSKEQRANVGYKDRTLFDRDLRKKDREEAAQTS